MDVPWIPVHHPERVSHVVQQSFQASTLALELFDMSMER